VCYGTGAGFFVGGNMSRPRLTLRACLAAIAAGAVFMATVPGPVRSWLWPRQTAPDPARAIIIPGDYGPAPKSTIIGIGPNGEAVLLDPPQPGPPEPPTQRPIPPVKRQIIILPLVKFHKGTDP
jgi:hypothetical protein